MFLNLMVVQKYLLIFVTQDKTQIFLTERIKGRFLVIHKLGSASSVLVSSVNKQYGVVSCLNTRKALMHTSIWS